MLGQVIHGYRVDRALSSDKGGFGDVFFATHVDSGAEAVVKVLKPEMSANRDIVARFFNEARAAASVHHPGIVQIHNVGYHGDRAYLLMERLRGDDLETRLQGGPLPVDRAVVFLRQAAGAIGAAHDRGIVHRDLKPANLFVVADPDVIGGERVKVLDFGIAKLTVDAGAGKTQGVFGTPAYMSPEQCASTGAVDARADLYSLGCIFYELCCGRPPFGHGGLELIASHLRDTPPAPRALAPWLAPAIEQVILRLLEKQPERRYASCAALVAALDEAAAASGLAGASQPHLPVGGIVSQPYPPSGGMASRPYPPPGSMASQPHLRSGGIAGHSVPSTTLGAAAGAASTPPARRGVGRWLALAAVVVVAGAGAAVFATRGGATAPGSGAPGDAAVAIAPPDAAPIAAVAPDAAPIAAITPDAAPIAAIVPDAAANVPDAPARVVRDAGVPRDAAAARDVAVADPAPQATESAAERSAKLVLAANELVRTDPNSRNKVIAMYREAAALAPNPKALFNLALLLNGIGHFSEAATAARGALALEPPDALASKTRKLLETIRREARSQGINVDAQGSAAEPAPVPSNPQVSELVQQARAEVAAGHHDKALALFQRAYEITPEPMVLLQIGLEQYQGGRCQDAERTLQRVVATWPRDPAAKQARARLARGGCE